MTTLNVKSIIADLEFDNDIEVGSHFNLNNPYDIQLIIDANNDIDTKELAKALALFNEKTPTIGKTEIKEVFVMLKDRELNPKGTFDKQGRFYLEDSELVDVRSPSTKYPYSQMNAGRTAKFVKAIVEKYKVNTKDELINYFKS